MSSSSTSITRAHSGAGDLTGPTMSTSAPVQSTCASSAASTGSRASRSSRVGITIESGGRSLTGHLYTGRPMIRLSIRAPAAAAKQVLAALLELTPEGVEQVDGDGWVEYALYGTPGELPSLGQGSASVGGVTVEVRVEEVPEDWIERWKRFHVPVLICGLL